MVIENNLAELEMSGNMRLTGTPGMPLLTGGISNRSIGETAEGIYSAFRKRVERLSEYVERMRGE